MKCSCTRTLNGLKSGEFPCAVHDHSADAPSLDGISKKMVLADSADWHLGGERVYTARIYRHFGVHWDLRRIS